MNRMMVHTTIAVTLLTVIAIQPARAQQIYRGPRPTTSNGVPSRFIHHHQARPIGFDNRAAPARRSNARPAIGYPQLKTPLYPAPRQDIPMQVGGTKFTNQAFAPHEMLYAHSYRALYPPYYYKVKGSWIWTPFGMESHDKWQLQGTEVKVNYRTSFSPFAFYAPLWIR